MRQMAKTIMMGGNDNDSWNCGAEGWTDDARINALRQRQMKNAVAMLMVSQGVPMILMGDELGKVITIPIATIADAIRV